MITPQEKCDRRGLLLNITGNGKGKTTSALGTAIRACGWGWRVVIVQFVKGDRETGEKRFFAGLNPPVEFISLGLGATWTPDVAAEQHVAAAAAAWRKTECYLNDPDIDLLVLDELNVALSLARLPVENVLKALRQRPPAMHVIVTGRYAVADMIAAADLVSEIQEIKHPFRQGIISQQGIEY